MKRSSHLLPLGAAALTFAALSATPAVAAGPILEPFSFEISEQDALMTEACGFPVDVVITAEGIDRTFASQPGGMAYLGTLRSDIAFTAGDWSVTFRERGQERAVANADGTYEFSFSGRFFGQSSVGRLVIDPVTEQVLSRSGTFVDYERLCQALDG